MLKNKSVRLFFSVHNLLSTRTIVIIALMTAIKFVLSHYTIAVTPSFKGFTLDYIPNVMVAALFGPWASIIFGVISDTVAYFAKPMGPYFPGYAISEMLECFIYACFVYMQKITYFKMAIARILIMLLVFFGLNFIWGSMLFGSSASGFFTSVRLINNIIQLPVYVVISTWAAKLALKINRQTQHSA